MNEHITHIQEMLTRLRGQQLDGADAEWRDWFVATTERFLVMPREQRHAAIERLTSTEQ